MIETTTFEALKKVVREHYACKNHCAHYNECCYGEGVEFEFKNFHCTANDFASGFLRGILFHVDEMNKHLQKNKIITK
jgi:hypothetical protein